MPASSLGFTMHLPDMLLTLGVALLSLLLLMNLRFKFARRGSRQSHSPTNTKKTGLVKGADTIHRDPSRYSSAELSESLVGAFDVAKDLLAQIDTRTRTLEILIRQADDRLQQLNQSIDDHVGASISPGKIAADTVASNGKDEAPPSSRSNGLTSSAPYNRTVVNQSRVHEPLRIDGPSRQQATLPNPPKPTDRPGRDQQTVEPLLVNVYELADRGRSAIEIARHLDEQIGKVELILALRQ